MRIDPVRFGEELKSIREGRCLSQARVAELSGLTVNYISLLENGDRQPSLDAVNSLAKALRVPAHFLLFLGGNPQGRFKALSDATCEAIRSAVAAEDAE